MYYSRQERAYLAALELLTSFKPNFWYGLTYSSSHDLGGELEQILLGKEIKYTTSKVL